MSHRPAPYPVQLDLFCQRWKNRRASYRPAGEIFDPRYASVEAVDEADAKAYVLANHYSASYPAARFRAGVFIAEPFRKPRLAGCGVFGVPMTQSVIPAYFPGLAPNAGVEFSRYVLDEELAANAESWAYVRMVRLMRQALPEVRGVLAYCDPTEWRDAAGALVKRGHVGTVYKATNARLAGTSSPRTLWLAPSGRAVAERMLSKIRLGETGERYAMQRLQDLGAPCRALREQGGDYIQRLKDERWLRPLRHPGNYAFTWNLR